MIDRMGRSYIILSSCFKCRLVCQFHCLTITEAIAVSHIYVRFEALSTADTRTIQSLLALLIYSVRKTVLELGKFCSINSTKSLRFSLKVLFNDSVNCLCYIKSGIYELVWRTGGIIMTGNKTEVLGEEAVPVPLCPPQITRLTGEWTPTICCKRKATSRTRHFPADISYSVSSEELSNIDCNSLHNTTSYNLVYPDVSKENCASIFR
jgi:hypothetical protein